MKYRITSTNAPLVDDALKDRLFDTREEAEERVAALNRCDIAAAQAEGYVAYAQAELQLAAFNFYQILGLTEADARPTVPAPPCVVKPAVELVIEPVKYTVDDVLAALKPYRKSNRHNPGGGCVYTAENGKHCVVGQVVADLGHEDLLPTWGHDDNIQGCAEAEWAQQIFERDALELLQEVQRSADQHVWKDGGLTKDIRPWWQAISAGKQAEGLTFS
jgi:hypothetical protein